MKCPDRCLKIEPGWLTSVFAFSQDNISFSLCHSVPVTSSLGGLGEYVVHLQCERGRVLPLGKMEKLLVIYSELYSRVITLRQNCYVIFTLDIYSKFTVFYIFHNEVRGDACQLVWRVLHFNQIIKILNAKSEGVDIPISEVTVLTKGLGSSECLIRG